MLALVQKYRKLSLVFLVAACLVAAGWAWGYGALRNISEPLILHFNNAIGINQVGSFAELTNAALLAFLVVVLNFLLALSLAGREPGVSGLLAVLTLLFGLLIFIGFAAIISVN